MVRVFTGGNELNDYTADEFAAYGTAESPTFNQPGGAQTPQGQGGKYVYYLNINGTGLRKDVTTGTMQVPNGIRECYIRFHYHAGNRSDGRFEMMRFLDASGAVIFSLEGSDNGSGGSYSGIYCIGLYQSNNTTIIHPAQYNFRNDLWHKVELYLKMATSGGVATLWVNDILVWTTTGNISGPSAQTFFTAFAPFTNQVAGGGLSFRAYDNIAINAIVDGAGTNIAGTVNNGRCGNGYVINAFPSRAGLYSQLTNDYGNSTNNFNHVNQFAFQNPTGFVGTNTPDQKDTYGLPRLPEEFRSVNVVKTVAYAVRNGTAVTKAKMLLEPGYQAPVSAPTVAMAAGGSVDAGTHTWAITNVQFINPNNNESLLGPASSPVTTVIGGTQTANLTSIPLGPTGTQARRIYRTKAGGSVYFLVGQINDNTTTIFTDTLADTALTSNPPVELALPAGVGVGLTLPVGGYGYISQHFETNTNSGNSPFTPAEFNSLEAGIQPIS